VSDVYLERTRILQVNTCIVLAQPHNTGSTYTFFGASVTAVCLFFFVLGRVLTRLDLTSTTPGEEGHEHHEDTDLGHHKKDEPRGA